jgi:ribosomal protein S18 acetylase RimI-like enzyme
MDVTLRRATDADAGAVADLYIRARRAATEYIPSTVHGDEDIRTWIGVRVVPHMEVWVAEAAAGSLVGLAVIDGEWLDQLYVEPTLTGRGIGTELLALAKRERSGGLRLKTFASNTGAQRFYERHGFTEAGRSDADNEEGAPDILYVWPGDR